VIGSLSEPSVATNGSTFEITFGISHVGFDIAFLMMSRPDWNWFDAGQLVINSVTLT